MERITEFVMNIYQTIIDLFYHPLSTIGGLIGLADMEMCNRSFFLSFVLSMFFIHYYVKIKNYICLKCTFPGEPSITHERYDMERKLKIFIWTFLKYSSAQCCCYIVTQFLHLIFVGNPDNFLYNLSPVIFLTNLLFGFFFLFVGSLQAGFSTILTIIIGFSAYYSFK